MNEAFGKQLNLYLKYAISHEKLTVQKAQSNFPHIVIRNPSWKIAKFISWLETLVWLVADKSANHNQVTQHTLLRQQQYIYFILYLNW